MEQREIYLDNSATTKVCAAALERAAFAMGQEYGNAASLHQKGYRAERMIAGAKKQIAGALSCDAGEIIFTSGATESNNLAVLGGTDAMKRRGKTVVTTTIEHASVLECMNRLESLGYHVVRIAPDKNGRFDPMDFYRAVDDDTVLVSVMHVNNEVGLCLPVMEIGKAVKRKNKDLIFHVDAVQGFLKLPLRLKNSPIDILSASGHKVHAPKGIGLLYLKKGVRITPLFYGGGQQDGIRPGTDNVPFIAAFGAAVETQWPDRDKRMDHFERLRSRLLEKVSEVPEISVNSPEDAVPYIVNLSVDRIRSEVMLHFLEREGIYVSSGSACSKGAKSHVLSALGLPDSRIDTALRVSFSAETSEKDIDIFVKKLCLGLDSLMKTK